MSRSPDDAAPEPGATLPVPAGSATDTARRMRPKDAATLIVVDRSDAVPRVLMGRRRADLVFMPGKYVFPGGRVDASDKQLAASCALSEAETAKLLLEMKGEPSPARATALALAAIRETFEEAGLVIGQGLTAPAEPRNDPWQGFFALGFAPRLDAVRFFARAITPPGRSRRFDTRFFWADAARIAHRTGSSDGELSGLHWLTAEEARAHDVATITRVILEDLLERLAHADGIESDVAVPFYHQRNGSFRRDLLHAQPAPDRA